ncbi:N-acetylglucosamine kinase [Paenibacillus sp. 1P07SE]|uniref:N-acetylglucosamine kinase n=1 Tax=Paenibacillus sp. 1P07SE TaxID=3132209 RepID=UPI0039A4C7AC
MSPEHYVLGVDGGNSKTDYHLYDLRGCRIAQLRTGTCSHERFADGYAGAERAMREQLSEILNSCDIMPADIAAAAFGLAGADIPSQKAELNKIIGRLGLQRYVVDNDSFLGLKAGSSSGWGICSINGSGACTGAIAPDGTRLQIGGVGSELAGDEAGGYYLSRRVLRAVYDACYRLGEPTALCGPVLDLLGLPDDTLLLERMVAGVTDRSLPYTELVTLLLNTAEQGDAAALAIVKQSAQQMARSAAGCVQRLDFGNGAIEVVLAGSVWVKADSPILRDYFQRYVQQLLPDKQFRFSTLRVPPATGAVLWAMEQALGGPVPDELRASIVRDGQIQS